MPLHYDMGRSVSPSALEPVRESSDRHRHEATECERRSGRITTQALESISIVGRNGHVGVQAHPTLPHAAGRNRRFRFDTVLPVFERLDPVAKTSPTLACLGAGRDPRANGCGREQSKERVVGCQRVLIRIEATALENPKDSARGPCQDPRDIFGLRRRERNERSEIVRGSGIDPVEHECVEMGREVQCRPEALNESDRSVMPTLDPMNPPRASALISE